MNNWHWKDFNDPSETKKQWTIQEAASTIYIEVALAYIIVSSVARALTEVSSIDSFELYCP